MNCICTFSKPSCFSKKNKHFVFSFAIYCLFSLRPFCLLLSHTVSESTSPLPTLPVCFPAAQKGADSRRVRPSGYWPSHMTEQMLSSNPGPRQQLGFVMPRRERGSFVPQSEWAASVTNHFAADKALAASRCPLQTVKSGKVNPLVVASRVLMGLVTHQKKALNQMQHYSQERLTWVDECYIFNSDTHKDCSFTYIVVDYEATAPSYFYSI